MLYRKKLNIVEDQIGSPTNAKDLVKMLMKIIPKLTIKALNCFTTAMKVVALGMNLPKKFSNLKISTNLNP